MVTPQMDREAFERQMRAELEILMKGVDEAESTVRRGTKELICRLNQSSASFRKTSENLKRSAQLESNAETIRQLVEGEEDTTTEGS